MTKPEPNPTPEEKSKSFEFLVTQLVQRGWDAAAARELARDLMELYASGKTKDGDSDAAKDGTTSTQ